MAETSDLGRAFDPKLPFRRPVYVVVCPVTSDPTAVYAPVVSEPQLGVNLSATSFDEELVPILPAIWYALHLPKIRYEMLALSPGLARRLSQQSRRHEILLLAADQLKDIRRLAEFIRLVGDPTLILCLDEHLDIAKVASSAAGFALPPTRVSDLSEASLARHWRAMNELWQPGQPQHMELDHTPPRWSADISFHGSELSRRRLARILGTDSSDNSAVPFDGTEPDNEADPQHSAQEGGPPRVEDPCESALEVRNLRYWLEALGDLDDQSIDPEQASPLIEQALADAARRTHLPLTLALPGVAPRYTRSLVEITSASPKGRPTEFSDGITTGSAGTTNQSANHAGTLEIEAPVEDGSSEGDSTDVLSLMVAHRVGGDDSMGILLTDPVPNAAFLALADLERYWIDQTRQPRNGAQPRKERKLRARLDKAMAPFWTDSMIGAIRSSSRIDVFSNFPIGLLHMPGHTAPLAASRPIAYRPINPLTRALQREFNPDRVLDLAQGMRVLVVECIPDADPVGAISRQMWEDTARRLTDSSRSVSVDVVPVSGKIEFATAVKAHRPDVLVVSAHGVYAPESNSAMLMIGTEPSMGDDLGPMPPMVILSSCHSGPRGAGPVAVSDLLLREGALAVLSTLAPVGVVHNTTFMSRFLMYISETIAGVESHDSVLDLWHRVQTGTVIFDIVSGNRHLNTWAYSTSKDKPPIIEFMDSRARGRLRSSDIYVDAEELLVEIAEERGDGDAVRGWLSSPGYLPESMMYTFIGDPSAISLRRPE